MAFTLQDLNKLIDCQAQEGFYLEFKRGAALGLSNEQRKELVKDCTAMANADGGMIVYGIEESEVDGSKVAAALSPVTTPAINKEWISEVLRTGTSPPLNRFEIAELALPDGSGRVLVVEIEAATTAHQNLRDHRYYQRAGSVTSAMVDFQIRDLMSRRSRPVVEVDVRTIDSQISPTLHRYKLMASIQNVGSVTIEKWWIEIDIPGFVVRDTRHQHIDLMSTQPSFHRYVRSLVNDGGRHVTRVSFGDPTVDGGSEILHPGQSMKFDGNYPQIFIEIDDHIYTQMEQSAPPLEWRIFLPNAHPVEGIVPFDQWCRY